MSSYGERDLCLLAGELKAHKFRLNHPRQTEKPWTVAQKGKFGEVWEIGLLIFLGFFFLFVVWPSFVCAYDASLDFFFFFLQVVLTLSAGTGRRREKH